jgi:ATP-binding cassette subfamily B protein
MIFDDSMSALDTETDAKIRGALKEKLGDSTVIIVSHRITTLMQADMILVMEDGRITERGTHTELVKNGGLYSRVYELQSKLVSDDGEVKA